MGSSLLVHYLRDIARIKIRSSKKRIHERVHGHRYYLQHIVHSVQTRLSSKSDGLPQSEMYEEEFGNVKLNSGRVPDILLP